MLSFDNSAAVIDYGPQHSTPVKEKGALLCSIQKGKNKVFANESGKVTTSNGDVKISNSSSLIQQEDLCKDVTLCNTDNSIIDISNISVIKCISDNSSVNNSNLNIKDNNETLVLDLKQVDNFTNNSGLCISHPLTEHQTKHLSSYKYVQTLNKLEKGKVSNKNDFSKCSYTGFHYTRALLPNCVSEAELLKPNLSPSARYQQDESSDLSYSKMTMSSSNGRLEKFSRKSRSSSAPWYFSDVNESSKDSFEFPSYSVPDFRRPSAILIEQDIINKQRQEIQLLMEELGNRDQELNDLVMSHQKQVKAWEGDNTKFLAVQTRLSQYEDEIKAKERHLKEALIEMSRVNEQREVDALELKQTQNEMVKLAERIMENSLYIKEIESQNQKLSYSLKELVNERKSFSSREQELLTVIEEKNSGMMYKQQKIDELTDHIKYLECHCEKLGERNNNTAVESINWKKKYFQLKEEVERLNAECKVKDDSVQKMTGQLHESLQQAIALQKALFTSCEREKCKEEVMYSLRKQHKRTTQELQNIRELYDRLSCDTTLYHLSVKDRETVKDGKKKEENSVDNKRGKMKNDGSARHEEETDQHQQGNKRKNDGNLSSQKLKQIEHTDQHSFLVKETKEKKTPTREVRNEESSAAKVNNKNSSRKNKSVGTSDMRCRNVQGKQETHECECENNSKNQDHKQDLKQTETTLKMKKTTTVSKPCHTTMCRNIATITSSTSLCSDEMHFRGSNNNKPGSSKKKGGNDIDYNVMTQSAHENTSLNADFHRSLTNSRASTAMSSNCVGKLFDRSTVTVTKDKSVMTATRGKDDGCEESSSDISHISPSQFDDELTPADSDGMCHELKRSTTKKATQHVKKISPISNSLESKRLKSKPSSLSSKGSFLRKSSVEENRMKHDDDEEEEEISTPTVIKTSSKKLVEFDSSEDLVKSASMETQSHNENHECDSSSQSLLERNPFSMSRESVYSKAKPCNAGQNERVSPERKKEKAVESCSISHSEKKYLQTTRNFLQSESDSEQEEEYQGQKCHNFEHNKHHKSVQCNPKDKNNCLFTVAPKFQAQTTNKATKIFELSLPKNNSKFSCSKGIISGSSKLSFNDIDSILEYNSSLNKSYKQTAQSTEKCRFNMCITHKDIISSPDTNTTDEELLSPKTKPASISASFKSPKVFCSDLPDKLSNYLAKHLLVKREMYNNNNSRLANSLTFDPNSKSKNSELEREILLHNQQNMDKNEKGGNNFENEHSGTKESFQDSVMLFKPNSETQGSQGIEVQAPPAKPNIRNFKQRNMNDSNYEEQCYVLRQSKEDKSGDLTVNCDPSCIAKVDDSHTVAIAASTSNGVIEVSAQKHEESFTENFDLRERSSICQVESNSLRNTSLLTMKGKESTDLSQVKPVLSSSSQVSSTANKQSLYNQLSRIHFSEKTRRYEWIKVPVATSQVVESLKGQHGDMPTHQEEADIKFMDLKNKDGVQCRANKDEMEIMSNACISRLDESIATEMSSNPNRKQSDFSNLRSDNGGSHWKCNQSDTFLASARTSTSGIQNDALHNANNNNNICSLSLNVDHYPVQQISHFSHPCNNLDSVSKRLSFNESNLSLESKLESSKDETFCDIEYDIQTSIKPGNPFTEMFETSSSPSHSRILEDAVENQICEVNTLKQKKLESKHFKTSNCVQCDCSVLHKCDDFINETYQYLPIFHVSSKHLDPVVKRLNFKDATFKESKSEKACSELCNTSEISQSAESNGSEENLNISSLVLPINIQVLPVDAETALQESHTFLDFNRPVKHDNKPSFSRKYLCPDSECAATVNGSQFIIPDLSVINGSQLSTNPEVSVTNINQQSNYPVPSITNGSPQSINPEISVTSNSLQSIKPTLLVTSKSQQLTNHVLSITSGVSQSVNPEFSVTSTNLQSIKPTLPVSSSSPSCRSPVYTFPDHSQQDIVPKHTIINYSSEPINQSFTTMDGSHQYTNSPEYTATNKTQQCINSGHMLTSDKSCCINSGHLLTNDKSCCINSGHLLTNYKSCCINSEHTLSNENHHCTNSECSIIRDLSKIISLFNASLNVSKNVIPNCNDHCESNNKINHSKEKSTFHSQLVAQSSIFKNDDMKLNDGRNLKDKHEKESDENVKLNTQLSTTLPNKSACDRHANDSMIIHNVIALLCHRLMKATISKANQEYCNSAFTKKHQFSFGDTTSSKIHREESNDCFMKQLNFHKASMKLINELDDSSKVQKEELESFTQMQKQRFDSFTKKQKEEFEDCTKKQKEEFEDFTKMQKEDCDDCFKMQENFFYNCTYRCDKDFDVCEKIKSDLDKVQLDTSISVDSNEKSLYTKDVIIISNDNINEMKEIDPGRFCPDVNSHFSASDCGHFDGQLCNELKQNHFRINSEANEQICCTEDRWDIPTWVHDASIIVPTDIFGDTLSVCLDYDNEENRPFIGKPLSPITKLHQVLAESQEMIRALENSSSGKLTVSKQPLLS